MPPDAEADAELSTCAELEKLEVELLVIVWASADDIQIADAAATDATA